MEERKFWRSVVQVEEVTETPIREGQRLDEHQLFLGCNRSTVVIRRHLASMAHVEEDVDDLCQRAALMRWQLADPIRSFNRILKILENIEENTKGCGAAAERNRGLIRGARTIIEGTFEKIENEHGLNTKGGISVKPINDSLE